MLSQNNAHPSSSKSMMPYDDDTLLANAHYIMKFPASQDETPKRLRLHSVIFFYISRISRCCTIQCSLCGCHTGCHNKVTGCIGCCMNLVNNKEESCLQKIKQPVHVDPKINIYRLIFYAAAFAIFKHPTLNVPMYIYLFCSLFRNRIYSVVIFLTFILKITIMPFDIQRLNFPCINQPIKYIPGFSAVF